MQICPNFYQILLVFIEDKSNVLSITLALLPDCLYRAAELWIFWSRSFTNLELFVLSETFRSGTILSETEVTAGDRLPARTAALSPCSLAEAACLGRTGEGVARSRGTCGGGITSERRGSGSEEGRAATVTRGLSGIVTRDT